MEFVILGSKVNEGCFSIKVGCTKLTRLMTKQYDLECFINRDGRDLKELQHPLNSLPNVDMKETTTCKLFHVHC